MSEYELHLGDCLDVMREMEAGSVDAIITDLPYGTTACAWDTIIPFAPMWEGVKRVLRPGGAFVTTASQPFTSALVMSKPGWFRYEWIWDKETSTGFLDANRKPLKAHESILVFAEGRTTYNPQKQRGVPIHSSPAIGAQRNHNIYNGAAKYTPADTSGIKYPKSIIQFRKHSQVETDHPTQKPVALYEYLIRTYTNPGDIVLDFCMGSGTTGVAALQLGRKFIGCEIDPGYFAIAEKRIEAAAAQPPLFVAEPQPKPTQTKFTG